MLYPADGPESFNRALTNLAIKNYDRAGGLIRFARYSFHTKLTQQDFQVRMVVSREIVVEFHRVRLL
jgi:hypothetical protein